MTDDKEITTQRLAPSEVLKLAKKLRARTSVCIGLHAGVSLPGDAEGSSHYAWSSGIILTMKQLERICEDAQRFANAKKEKGETVLMTVSTSEEVFINAKRTYLWVGGI